MIRILLVLLVVALAWWLLRRLSDTEDAALWDEDESEEGLIQPADVAPWERLA